MADKSPTKPPEPKQTEVMTAKLMTEKPDLFKEGTKASNIPTARLDPWQSEFADRDKAKETPITEKYKHCATTVFKNGNAK